MSATTRDRLENAACVCGLFGSFYLVWLAF